MANAFDKLRAGEVVEIEPGRKGRLNLKDKTFETSDGKKIFVGDDEDFFPSNNEALLLSREKEGLEREIAHAPIGGEFLYQFGQQGIAGGLKNTINKIMMSGDDYLRRRKAESQVSSRISKESPWTSGAATAASFAPDIALTGGMSAARAAPLLTALHAGPRIVEEPGQVLGEAALGSAAGKFIDMGANWLSRTAKRRGEIRSLPGQQAEVEAQNLAQQQQYKLSKEDIRSKNAQRLEKYESDVNQRKNQMIEAKNQRSMIQEQNKRLSDEYKIAEQQYKESLKGLPELQAKAQKEYSANVARVVDEIESRFPKNARIVTNEIDVPGFIESNMSKSLASGSKEASQANRILSSLFPEGEVLTSRELAKRYKSIEEAIQKSTPEVKTILSEFKNHLGERLPNILSNQMAYERVLPTLQKQVIKDVEGIFKKMPQEASFASPTEISKRVKENVERYFDTMTPQNFIEKIKTREFRDELIDSVLTPWDLLPEVFRPGKNIAREEFKNLPLPGFYQQKGIYDKTFQMVNDQIRNKLDNALAKAEIKMIGVEHDASKRLGSRIGKTYGIAQELAPPVAPMSPSPTPLPSNQIPSLPPKPSMIPEPIAPIPQPIPTLSQNQGSSDMAAQFLEKDLLGGKGMVNNPITKLAGLKYLAGGAALPLEAAYVGAKALTSPTPIGEGLRMSFKKGGIQAIDQMAQKYRSYHDGILEDPIERRSLNKEIEMDSEIPLDQKAILQSKVNRGKSIFERLS